MKRGDEKARVPTPDEVARHLTREVGSYIRENAGSVHVDVWMESELNLPLQGVQIGDLICPDCACKKGTEHDEFCYLGDLIKSLKGEQI